VTTSQPDRKTIRSDIAWSTPDRVVVRGRDLPGEILGEMNLGDFAYLELTGEVAGPAQARLFNAIVITLVEHGITPSSLVARLTYLGAPESLQAAVAAGLCGLGTVFVGSTEGAARMLWEVVPPDAAEEALPDIARAVVADAVERRSQIPGIGHPLHKPVDPRAVRLFELAREEGMPGRYVKTMELIADEATAKLGRVLPVNATGAIGAVACELGLPWRMVRGLGVMARAIGLVGHILEETERPIAAEIWQRAEAEASEHLRPEASEAPADSTR
jgi:citrate synthase